MKRKKKKKIQNCVIQIGQLTLLDNNQVDAGLLYNVINCIKFICCI